MANIYGVQFDEVNDYFNITDDAALDIIIASGSQFYAFWLEVDDNSGSFFQYFFSNGTFGGANTVNAFVNEASGGTPNIYRVVTGDTDANSAVESFPTGYVFIVIQYNTNGKLELVMCDEAGTASRTISATDQTENISSNTWNMGRRTDGNSDRYYGGKIFNFVKGSTLLTNTQIENLASDFLNYDPTDEFTPDLYFPMNEGTGTTITDDVIGLTASGIGFPGDDSQWTLEGTTVTVTVTGTAVPTQTEADIVTGGKTIILTLTGDTFVTGTTSEDGIAAGSLSDIPSNA